MMKLYPLNDEDRELIERAREVIRKNYVKSKKYNMTVASALLSKKRKIFLGVNFENKVTVEASISSEMAAIARLIGMGEEKIDTIVAVSENPEEEGYKIKTPCGVCEKVIQNFGNPFVIVSDTDKVRAKDLYQCAE